MSYHMSAAILNARAELDPNGNVGVLYVCDRDGNNAEPICATDTPTTLDDFLGGLNANDGDGNTYRAATGADNLSSRVDVISVNAGGEIVGYYRWVSSECVMDEKH